MNRSTPGLPVHYQLPEFTQSHVHRVRDAIQPSHPWSSLLFLAPIPPKIKVFFNESTLLMRWPRYWSFTFSIISSKEIPGLSSFRMDWLDLLAGQGTLKSLLQHHSAKTSVLQHIPRNFHGRIPKHQDCKLYFSSSSLSVEDPPQNFTPGCQKPHWKRGLGPTVCTPSVLL